MTDEESDQLVAIMLQVVCTNVELSSMGNLQEAYADGVAINPWGL